jgi:hypothetical protein
VRVRPMRVFAACLMNKLFFSEDIFIHSSHIMYEVNTFMQDCVALSICLKLLKEFLLNLIMGGSNCEPIVYRKCENLDVLQPYGPSRPVTGIDFTFLLLDTGFVLDVFPPKCWLTFNGLHGIKSQKIELSNLYLILLTRS